MTTHQATRRAPLMGPRSGRPMDPEWLSAVALVFWRKVARGADNECWEWTASRRGGGYGQIHFRRINRPAHRVAYELLVGPIPPGLTLDHLCRNRRCVNPAHLEPVTISENVRRAVGGGTHCKRGHEFTPDNVLFIPDGRKCKTCNRARQRAYAVRRKARLAGL